MSTPRLTIGIQTPLTTPERRLVKEWVEAADGWRYTAASALAPGGVLRCQSASEDTPAAIRAQARTALSALLGRPVTLTSDVPERRGGRRPGAGVRPLDPEAGRLRQLMVALPEAQLERLTALGDGSRSAGVRRAVEAGLAALDGETA